jgi:protein TonB
MRRNAADIEPVRTRAGALLGVAALHLLLGYALLTGLGVATVKQLGGALKVFAVREQPAPPLPKPVPAKTRIDQPEGAASPPNLKARPTPIVAPAPEIRLPVEPKLVTVTEPKPGEPGSAAHAGASAIAGPGTGAGGEGVGSGAGGQGSGTGGGGASPAVRLGGALDGARDYPRASRKAGIEGSVSVRFTVATDGRVDFCRVLRSTTNAEIEATTCRLIQRRFVYRPARDSGGRPIEEVVTRTFHWSLPEQSSIPERRPDGER